MCGVYKVGMFNEVKSWGDAIDVMNKSNHKRTIFFKKELVKFKSSNGKSKKFVGLTNEMKFGSFMCRCCLEDKDIFDDMGNRDVDYYADGYNREKLMFSLLSDNEDGFHQEPQEFFNDYLYGKKGGIEASLYNLRTSNQWRSETEKNFLEYCKEIKELTEERETLETNDGILICEDCITNDIKYNNLEKSETSKDLIRNKINTDTYLSFNIKCCACEKYIGSMMDYKLNGHSIKSKLYCDTCKNDNSFGIPLENSPKLKGQCNNCFIDDTYTKNCFECITQLGSICENKDCVRTEIAKRSGWNKILISDDFEDDESIYEKINNCIDINFFYGEQDQLCGKDLCKSCYTYELNKLDIHQCVGDCRGNGYCKEYVNIANIHRYSRLMYDAEGASQIVIDNRLHYPHLVDETLMKIRTEDIRDKHILRNMDNELDDLLCLRNLDRIPYDINENNTINSWDDTFIELPILCDDNECYSCFYECEECQDYMSYEYLYKHYIKPFYSGTLTESQLYASIVGCCCKFSKSCVVCKSVDSDIGFCDGCINKPKDLKDKTIFDRLKLNITKLNEFKSKRLKCNEDIEESECAICMGEVIGCLAERKKCKHTFHIGCDYQWSEINELCAYCRSPP